MSKYDELLKTLGGAKPSPDQLETLRQNAHQACIHLSTDLDGLALDNEGLVYSLVTEYFAENGVFGGVEIFRNRPFPGLTGLACAILGDYERAALNLAIFLDRSRVKVFLYPYGSFLG